MRVTKCLFAGLAASLVMCATGTYAGEEGPITKPSKYSAKETVARFEAAVKQREAAGFIVFTEIDHADAAKKFGLNLRPRTVIIFGNPKGGTPAMVKTPLLAIDLPPKALVWEDDEGKVARGICRQARDGRFSNGVAEKLIDGDWSLHSPEAEEHEYDGGGLGLKAFFAQNEGRAAGIIQCWEKNQQFEALVGANILMARPAFDEIISLFKAIIGNPSITYEIRLDFDRFRANEDQFTRIPRVGGFLNEDSPYLCHGVSINVSASRVK